MTSLRGIDPARQSRANLDGILAEARRQRPPRPCSSGWTHHANYGADYRGRPSTPCTPNWPRSTARCHHPQLPLAALAEIHDRAQVLLQTYMQGDGIHPNSRGVALIVGDIGPSVLKLVESVE